MRMLGALLAASASMLTPPLLLRRSGLPLLRRSTPAMALPRGGADLSGGLDEERNAEVAALKRLFYNDATEEDDAASADAVKVGYHVDLPFARWGSEPFLPFQQVLLNIFQPEYTHLFESLVATPKPWLYMHVQLPGGIASLGSAEYALPGIAPPGAPSLAPLEGTLMQCVSYSRLDDSRLRIVVQGLGRATVVRGTQSLPYARGDVQLLPDSEALLDAARLSREWLQGSGEEVADDAATFQARMRMALAATAAEDACWRKYENKPYELRAGKLPPAYSSFDSNELEAAANGANSSVQQAIAEVAMAAAAEATGTADAVAESSGAERAASGGLASESVASALREAIAMTPMDEEPAEAAAEAAEDLRTLAALEVQVWLEVDALLRGIALRSGDADAMPAPIQLLGLMPPPPEGGWPESFALQRVVSELQKAEATKSAYAGLFGIDFDEEDASYEPYVAVDERYPPRRRAQRLSYSIWQVIAAYWGGLELQPALEVESTSDRLRMALLRLRALAEQIKDKGYGDLV